MYAMKYDKLNYMEGSLWMLEKLTKEVTKFSRSIIEMTNSINNDVFKSVNPTDIVQNYKWFVDNVDVSKDHLM